MNKDNQVSTSTQEAEQDSQWIGERRQVSGAPYMLPDADQEIDRLDLQHYMLRYVLKGNYLAPIAEPARILDVGCGTGRWLAEMAQEFPRAEAIGIDLTPPEMGSAMFPPNCQFQQANTLNGLPFEDNSFDFVHQRLLLFAIPAARWPQLIQELVRVTRVQGWIELTEVDPLFQHIGPATERVLDLVVRAMQQLGMDPAIGHHIGPHLQAAGLAHVETSTRLIPCGKWAGRLGSIALADVMAIAQALKPVVAAQKQTTLEEYDSLMAQMEEEVEQYHTTFNFHFAYGQR